MVQDFLEILNECFLLYETSTQNSVGSLPLFGDGIINVITDLDINY